MAAETALWGAVDIKIDYKTVGARIRFHRVRNGISQEELAYRTGLSRGHISCVERGERVPSVETIIAVANVFNVTTDELLSDFLLISNDRWGQAGARLFLDCTAEEIEILLKTLEALKGILRAYNVTK